MITGPSGEESTRSHRPTTRSRPSLKEERCSTGSGRGKGGVALGRRPLEALQLLNRGEPSGQRIRLSAERLADEPAGPVSAQAAVVGRAREEELVLRARDRHVGEAALFRDVQVV